MALRNILVHVAEDARCDERVRLACGLAAQDDGMVTGLFARPYPVIVPAMPPGGAVTVVVGRGRGPWPSTAAVDRGRGSWPLRTFSKMLHTKSLCR